MNVEFNVKLRFKLIFLIPNDYVLALHKIDHFSQTEIKRS